MRSEFKSYQDNYRKGLNMSAKKKTQTKPVKEVVTVQAGPSIQAFNKEPKKKAKKK